MTGREHEIAALEDAALRMGPEINDSFIAVHPAHSVCTAKADNERRFHGLHPQRPMPHNEINCRAAHVER